MKQWRFYFLASVLPLVFSAFWGAGPALGAGAVQAALVTDVGKIDDRTFNEFAYKGMQRAAGEFGLETSFIETQQPTDYQKNIEQFIGEGIQRHHHRGVHVGGRHGRHGEKVSGGQIRHRGFRVRPAH